MWEPSKLWVLCSGTGCISTKLVLAEGSILKVKSTVYADVLNVVHKRNHEVEMNLNVPNILQ